MLSALQCIVPAHQALDPPPFLTHPSGSAACSGTVATVIISEIPLPTHKQQRDNYKILLHTHACSDKVIIRFETERASFSRGREEVMCQTTESKSNP